MNSEDLARANNAKLIESIIMPDKQAERFIKIANDFEQLVSMPAWKQLANDLEGVRKGLFNELLEVKDTCELKARIKNIDLILNSPKGYIEQSKLYLARIQKHGR